MYANIKRLNDYNTIYDNVKLNDLRNVLRQDIDNLLVENDMAFIELLMNYNAQNDKEIMMNEQGYLLEIFEKISDADENYLGEIYLNKDFVNTLQYLK